MFKRINHMINIRIQKVDIKPRKRGLWSPLRGKSGVYAFLKDDEALYIGRSKNLYQRLIAHFSRSGIHKVLPFDEVVFIFCDNHKELEKRLIEYFDPDYNGSLTQKIY